MDVDRISRLGQGEDEVLLCELMPGRLDGMEIERGAVRRISHPQLFQPLKAFALQRLRYSFPSPHNLAFAFGHEGKWSFSNAENNSIVWGFSEELCGLFLGDGGRRVWDCKSNLLIFLKENSRIVLWKIKFLDRTREILSQIMHFSSA